MIDLTAFDDGFGALSRHLPWDCFVAPSILLLEEDASLMAVIEYGGRDAGQREPAERLQAAAVADVLHPFTGGWIFHFELQRRAVRGHPPRHRPPPLPALIDAERRTPPMPRAASSRSPGYPPRCRAGGSRGGSPATRPSAPRPT